MLRTQSIQSLFEMQDNLHARWASPENPGGEKGSGGKAGNGRKGSPCFHMEAGETRVLAEERNTAGTIRRIWMTIGKRDKEILRGIRLDFYWDGCKKPAVSVPLGDFFCHGQGLMSAFDSALFSSPEGRSFNCCVPMPFRKGMKITITNELPEKSSEFYYDIDYTVGDIHPDNMLYFHAWFNRGNPTTELMDHEILPGISGKGRFLGCNMGVTADRELYHNSWWGEGEVKIFLDGDREYPTLCGTGTEDYIGAAYGQGRYANLYQGCQHADYENMQYNFYRYHIPDPIFFHKDIRVTIQQIGCWDPASKVHLHYKGTPIVSTKGKLTEFSRNGDSEPYGLYERHDDWCSVAYFYLDRPENDLPELMGPEERIK